MKSKKKIIVNEDIESLGAPDLTTEQQAENLEAYRQFRTLSEARRTDKDRLKAQLIQLKYLMEDNMKADELDYDFSYFLQEYINRIELKNKEFAHEIDVDPTLLSQILNKRRKPNEQFIVRLELHSNANFPAIMWYRILEKEREHELMHDMNLRREQNRHIKRRLNISF